ncbi:hypothetical protein BVF91_07455 [Thermoanaerobacterium sp. PSU-2]|uniref:RAMP superfamily CRISPR-associated protein n=1 Tax=Thermoanaerobacterium sp. PSU-2 TaxID=1930849 RepID=UPI000A166CE1|nr:RAMP superfamily CRISPR-associated protein [Thermoanaerobacterium sp. PSU-2]ORX23353.1 hypothetical protein BVF91_07455 [Thermoanaerobacterium sp. PSU-2]
MHIKVELKSDLCISSGEGLSGIIDVDVIYDDNGIPYLPAKRFKGILREAAEDISDIYPEKYSQKIINDLFGDPETNSVGELYIDNGYIENYHTIAKFIKMCNNNKSYKNLFPKQYVKSYFTNIHQQTAIDRKNGISKDKSLRVIRTIKKGNLFYLNINIDSIIDYDKKVELLRDACKIIRHIGLSRTRGLGEVRCKLIENNINEINKGMNSYSGIGDNNNKKYKMTYIIELLSDTIVSNIGGNSNVTNSYISGSNVLGYFATQYIKKFKVNDAENDPVFKRIFLSKDVSFLNAYPTDKKNNDYIPVPISIVKQKDKENYFDLAYDEDYEYIKEERIQTNSLSGNYINIQDKYINIINPKYVLHYHHKRPEDKSFGHATKKSGEFYSYLSLCAGEKFKGCIIGSKSDLGLIKELIPENSIIFIGKSKNAEYSRAKISFGEIEMLNSEISINDEEKLIITLTSPMILCNEYGNIDSDPRNFIKIIQEEYPSLVCNDKYFIRHVTVYGFNSKWGLPRQQVQALASGSVFVFDIKDKNNDFSGLSTKAYGLRTNEGFGRIAVNIHGFKPLEKMDNENDEYIDMNLISQHAKPLIIYIEIEKIKKELIKKAISDAKKQKYGLENMTNSTIGRLKTLLKKSNSEEDFKKLLSEEFKKERKINGIKKYLDDNTFINILQELETYQTFKKLNIDYIEGSNIVNELFAFYYTKLFNVLRHLKREKEGARNA